MDYTLKPSSPAFATGFAQIDVSTTGLTAAFPWRRADIGRCNATEKVQTERYNRMQGLWREGSLGISGSGSPSKGFLFSPNAWARFDNVYCTCPSPCRLTFRFKGGPARLAMAVGAPLAANIVASVETAGLSAWTLLNTTVTGTGLSLSGATLFLMLNASCSIDYFFFGQ